MMKPAINARSNLDLKKHSFHSASENQEIALLQRLRKTSSEKMYEKSQK